MLKAFNLLEFFLDYDIIVTITMPSLGYYHALGLYSAGQSTYHYGGQNRTFVDALVNLNCYASQIGHEGMAKVN